MAFDIERIIKSVAWRYGKNDEDREDFAQEARLDLLKAEDILGRLLDDDAEKYAYTVAKNAVLRLIRGQPDECSLSDRSVQEEAETHDIPVNFFDDIDRKLDIEKMRELLEKIPEKYQDILKSRYGIGRPQQTLSQLSKKYRVVESTIMRWEQRAVDMLKGKMKGKMK